MEAHTYRIAVDAMGGDNAPEAVVEGALLALKERSDLTIVLTGPEEKLRTLLKSQNGEADRVEIVPASEVIGPAEHPVMSIKRKKDSSLVKGFDLLKEGRAEALLSAGNSGAVLSGGMLKVGRRKGVERSPFAVLIPTEKGVSLLVDGGANVDAKPSYLVQFAQMGSIYMEHVMGVKNPRVGLVNIGAEEEKGNKLVKDTMPLLKELSNINFIGSVEARDISSGAADVVVCDAFVGNVILKVYEGVAGSLMKQVKKGLMSSFRSKIGALLIKPALKKTLKVYDTSEYGGAPVLGLKELVVKAHGSSTPVEFKNAILQCITFQEQRVNERISEYLTVDKAEEETTDADC